MTLLRNASGEIACICHEHNPRCLCLPHVDSHSLVPAAPFQPTRAQLRFLRLHTFHCVEQWRWHWYETMLRATTDRGVTATLWVDSVEELVREGLMEAGMGYAMSVTDAGRELLARERNRS